MNINNRVLWSSLKVPGASVSVQPRPHCSYMVMRVSSVVDTGNGEQTAVLGDVPMDSFGGESGAYRKNLSIPRKIANLNCLYTGKRFGIVSDAYAAVKRVAQSDRLAAIVPDVIAPGDFVVFRHVKDRSRAQFAGVLRALPA
jgi:hypothetical protein